jgi:hypothetical protein
MATLCSMYSLIYDILTICNSDDQRVKLLLEGMERDAVYIVVHVRLLSPFKLLSPDEPDHSLLALKGS